MPNKKVTASFIEPMLLQRTENLPEGPEWLIELKLDGYRAQAIKSGGKVQLRSRNGNTFNTRYAGLVKALSSMPDETVIDGEVVALDEEGRPSFNTELPGRRRPVALFHIRPADASWPESNSRAVGETAPTDRKARPAEAGGPNSVFTYPGGKPAGPDSFGKGAGDGVSF